MKKIFKEYGGVVIVVIAVVALIGLVGLLMQPGGVLDGAFSAITRSFVNKTSSLLSTGKHGALSVVIDGELSTDSSQPTLTENTALALSGRVTGAEGDVTLAVNGTAATVNQDGSWSTSLDLPEGEIVEVVIVATDKRGNSETITGYVLYDDFEEVTLASSHFELIGYEKGVAEFEIPATFQKSDGTWCKVVGIGYGTFQNHTSLTKIKVPEGVTSLDSNAFYGCTGLTSVGLSGSGASIELPNSLTKISYSAFEKCSGIISVVIPKNVKTIYSSAFEKCSLLADVKFEAGSVLTNIYEYAFSECPKLTSVGPAGSGCDFEIPNSLTSLYREVFSRDTNITKFIIPDSMTSIDPDAFAMLTGLQAFEVGANNSAYCAVDGVLYSKDMKTLVRYPAARSYYSFTVPAGVTTIGKYAFEDSVKLCNVTLPSGLTTLSYYAFAFCDNLETITIPASVTYISSYVFYNCYYMDTAVFENTNGWSVSKDGVTTEVDVTDAAANAQNFRHEYLFHSWSRA